MKTLLKDNVSLYLFADDKSLSIEKDSIVVGDPLEFIILDCNSSNTVLVENVSAPADWVGGKYVFDNGVWSINIHWVDPVAAIIAARNLTLTE